MNKYAIRKYKNIATILCAMFYAVSIIVFVPSVWEIPSVYDF